MTHARTSTFPMLKARFGYTLILNAFCCNTFTHLNGLVHVDMVVHRLILSSNGSLRPFVLGFHFKYGSVFNITVGRKLHETDEK